MDEPQRRGDAEKSLRLSTSAIFCRLLGYYVPSGKVYFLKFNC